MAGYTDGGRYFNFPSYSASDWTARNPLLNAGEVGFELHPSTGLPWRCKIGPGLWNSLSYLEDFYYSSTHPTNVIGDAFGNLQYLSIRQILEKMLNPFAVPVLSTPLVNVNSLGYVVTRTLEIGQTIASPVLVAGSVDLPGNLAAGSPYEVTAGGFFTNEGVKASLPASMTLSPSTPTSPLEVIISVRAAYTGGQGGWTNTIKSFINVYPKLIWGTTAAPTVAPSDWATLSGRQTLISKSFQNDYPFTTTGYLYLAIPSMLNPGSLFFGEVTNPIEAGPITFLSVGTQSINNGVGVYNYNTYRSLYAMTSQFIVRVR